MKKLEKRAILCLVLAGMLLLGLAFLSSNILPKAMIEPPLLPTDISIKTVT